MYLTCCFTYIIKSSEVGMSKLAATALRQSLQESGVSPDEGLRLKEENGQFMLSLDAPRGDDYVIRYDKAIILIISRDMAERVGEAVVGVEETPLGPDLVMRRSGWRL